MPLIGSTDDHLADDASTLGPITIERIGQMLSTLEINYGHEPEGEIIVGMDGHLCWFGVGGPGEGAVALIFDARWERTLTMDQLDEALALVNDWNQNATFPRAMVAVDQDGNVLLGADHARDCEFGITDMQLRNEILIAISTTVGYWKMLDERFPAEAAQDEAQVEG